MIHPREVRRAALAACLCCFAATGLRADFSYEQTSKITGGAMATMMKVVGVFSRTAREPIRTSVVVKGDRMGHLSADHATIIDLAAETVTEVNLKQKTYSVLTFAQIAQAMERMAQKTAEESGGKAEINFKAAVKESGQTRQISGFPAHEVILTLVMEGTDKQSGEKGSMTVTSNIWLAKDVPGYGEVQSFHRRMAQKLAWMPGSNAFAQGRGDMAKAFGDLQRESAKLEGVPLLQTVTMGGAAEGQPGQPAGDQQASRTEEGSRPSIGGALKGLGGLGGFGRKKKEEPKQDQPAASGGGGGSVSLLEMTTETTNFSAGPVDAAKLQVPAGFRQVESDMEKALR
ncbi:MAG: hypothetical protein IT159_03255 [Bryobacterales bacterium]|nr:hypothetical protein [Bryobacterales bacterium]